MVKGKKKGGRRRNPIDEFLESTDPSPMRMSKQEKRKLLQTAREKRIDQQVRNKLRLKRYHEAFMVLLPLALPRLRSETIEVLIKKSVDQLWKTSARLPKRPSQAESSSATSSST
jgi:hypothetical protein